MPMDSEPTPTPGPAARSAFADPSGRRGVSPRPIGSIRRLSTRPPRWRRGPYHWAVRRRWRRNRGVAWRWPPSYLLPSGERPV